MRQKIKTKKKCDTERKKARWKPHMYAVIYKIYQREANRLLTVLCVWFSLIDNNAAFCASTRRWSRLCIHNRNMLMYACVRVRGVIHRTTDSNKMIIIISAQWMCSPLAFCIWLPTPGFSQFFTQCGRTCVCKIYYKRYKWNFLFKFHSKIISLKIYIFVECIEPGASNSRSLSICARYDQMTWLNMCKILAIAFFHVCEWMCVYVCLSVLYNTHHNIGGVVLYTNSFVACTANGR